MNKTYGYVQPLLNVNCFITTLNSKDIFQTDWTLFGCFYLQLWLVFLYNIYCVVKVVLKIKKDSHHNPLLKE
jgi:hypothetical protein